jgi:hypothetical protein
MLNNSKFSITQFVPKHDLRPCLLPGSRRDARIRGGQVRLGDLKIQLHNTSLHCTYKNPHRANNFADVFADSSRSQIPDTGDTGHLTNTLPSLAG